MGKKLVPIMSPTPPKETNVLWLDTSGDNIMPKVFSDGWLEISARAASELVEDVEALAAEIEELKVLQEKGHITIPFIRESVNSLWEFLESSEVVEEIRDAISLYLEHKIPNIQATIILQGTVREGKEFNINDTQVFKTALTNIYFYEEPESNYKYLDINSTITPGNDPIEICGGALLAVDLHLILHADSHDNSPWDISASINIINAILFGPALPIGKNFTESLLSACCANGGLKINNFLITYCIPEDDADYYYSVGREPLFEIEGPLVKFHLTGDDLSIQIVAESYGGTLS